MPSVPLLRCVTALLVFLAIVSGPSGLHAQERLHALPPFQPIAPVKTPMGIAGPEIQGSWINATNRNGIARLPQPSQWSRTPSATGLRPASHLQIAQAPDAVAPESEGPELFPRDRTQFRLQPDAANSGTLRSTQFAVPRVNTPDVYRQALPKELHDPVRMPRIEREYSRFVQDTLDPELPLEIVSGRPRILSLSDTPVRVYIPDESVARYDLISGTEIAIVGEKPGKTVVMIWVKDDQNEGKLKVLRYLVRVYEDRIERVRRNDFFEDVASQINQVFPDSVVSLSLIGEQVIVRGQAKDVIEAQQIIKIVELHAPNNRRDQSVIQAVSVGGEALFNQTTEGAVQANNAGQGQNPNVINLLSIPGEQQVMLRVTVAEVNRSALRSIGANITAGGTSGVGTSSVFPPRVSNMIAQLATVIEGGTFSVARTDFSMAFDALKQQNLARTLAEPNLVSLSGRSAQFQAGGQFPVPAAQVGFGAAAQGVQFIPFGVQLQFTPYIVDRDKIRLNVSANVSTRDDATAVNVSGSNVPSLTTRNFQNTVELREGQTLAVAGLVQTNFGANSSRVPGVGDLPVFGRLFKRDGTSADEQELVILITPELVRPVEAEEHLSLPGSDLFEPSDLEFFVKGFLESRRSYDYRSPARTDWARMQKYHCCEEALLIGPTGHSHNCRAYSMPGSHHGEQNLAAPVIQQETLPSPTYNYNSP